MEYNVEQVLDIFSNNLNITHTAKKYCKLNKIKYDDGIRRRLSTVISKNKHKIGIVGDGPKIIVYDIETSYMKANVWWTGEQRINHKQLNNETRIITVAWKELGEDDVHYLKWDMKKHCDKKLMKDFLKVYNEADMVIGVNNNSFDNKLVRTRAAKHGIRVNRMVKSFDVLREARKEFRLPSYSMDYMSKFFDVTYKQSHEGMIMWEMIQEGTSAQQAEYMEKMIEYNIGDIVTTEDLYLKLRPYMVSKIHLGMYTGAGKVSCPDTGSEDVRLYHTSVTGTGNVQRIMICDDSGIQFKISNSQYFSWLKELEEQED